MHWSQTDNMPLPQSLLTQITEAYINYTTLGPLFAKQTDVLLQDLMESRRCKIRCRDACQISKRYCHYNMHSHGFETSRDFGDMTSYRLVNGGSVYQVKANPRLRSVPPWRSGPAWRYTQTPNQVWCPRSHQPSLTYLWRHFKNIILIG